MADRMTMTEALDERLLLSKRIRDKIKDLRFVDAKRNVLQTTFASRKTPEEFAKEAEADYQSLTDLIDRYNCLNAAIVNSNAATKIEVSGVQMSVASAISQRDSMKKNNAFSQQLIEHLKNQSDFIELCVNDENRGVRGKAEKLRNAVLDESSVSEIVDNYIFKNSMEVVDPLNVKCLIDFLRKENDDLLRELDSKIKISNATTYIEI